MSEQMTEEQAIEALMGAAQSDGHERSDQKAFREAQQSAQEQASSNAPEGTESAEEQPETDSFTKLDPNSLPEEVQPYYKSMQGDYTRSKQELSERERQFEALEQYGGVDVATQALDWIASLQNPDNAKALRDELTQVLTEQGYSFEDAQAAATSEVNRQANAEVDDFDEGVRDPRVDELQAKLDNLEKYREQQETRQYELALQAEMDRQEAEILRDNPDFGEADIETIYNLSFSNGGNLLEARDQYVDLQSRILGGYIDKKGSVTTGARDIPATAASDEPEVFEDLNDPRLENIVNRFVAERMAQNQ